jgi:hypothetical protein
MKGADLLENHFGNRSMNRQCLAAFFFSSVICSELLAYQIEDQTPGSYALNYQKQRKVWSSFSLVGVDASIKTSPPDSKKISRSVISGYKLGGDWVFGNQMGLRINAYGQHTMRKDEEAQPPKAPLEESQNLFYTFMDYTYVTPKGLEIFIGAQFTLFPSYQQTQEGEGPSLETEFDRESLVTFRAGILKRHPSWSGGFYYVQGRETERSFTQKVSGEAQASDFTMVHIPTEFGIIAAFSVSPVVLQADFAMVQAGGGGEKSVDGVTVRDDYLRFHGAAQYLGGGWGMDLSFKHQTLSYSNHAFVNLDSIPTSKIELASFLGQSARQISLGLMYGFGDDGQSIPEFNADYSLRAFGFRLGLIYPI